MIGTTTDESLRLERVSDRPKSPARVPRGIRKRRVGRLRGYVVHIVRGERVRNEIFCDFVFGGTGSVYSFIPLGEIWIDDALNALDATATLLHEFIESERMKSMKETYEQAHDVAAEREAVFREQLAANRPRKLDVKRVDQAILWAA